MWMSLLLVLGLQVQILPRYFDVKNGVVIDTDEQFVWAATSSAAMNREAADRYVRTLGTAGYTDWRLPTAKELQELFDDQQCHPLTTDGAAATVCLTPAISLLGPAVWTRDGDAEGGEPTVVQFTKGEVQPAPAGTTAVVLPVRKSSYE